MLRTDITVSTSVVLVALAIGLFGGAGFGWLSTDGASTSVRDTAGHVLDVGVAEAAAADQAAPVLVTASGTASTPVAAVAPAVPIATPAPAVKSPVKPVVKKPVITKPVAKKSAPKRSVVRKPVAKKPAQKARAIREQAADKFLPMRLLADESTAGPGTAAILRRKRGEYAGRLIPIDRTSACPRVAMAFFRMRADAQRNGVKLRVVNGFRTKSHQRRLYRELGPVYAAKPGKSLHHRASELDITMRPGGGDRTHRWLIKHGPRYGFVQRYSWEPWHWGFVRGC